MLKVIFGVIPHEQVVALTHKVREIMKALGYDVVERPAPRVILGYDGKELGCYVRATHTVKIKRLYEGTLVHELTHSQQPDWVPTYFRPDGELDNSAWLASPQEQEAMTVEHLYRYDVQSIARAVEVLKQVGIKPTADWVEWVIHGDITRQKPHHLPRKTRITINNILRQAA